MRKPIKKKPATKKFRKLSHKWKIDPGNMTLDEVMTDPITLEEMERILNTYSLIVGSGWKPRE